MPQTRITGGEWRGRVVETPPGLAIRPTRAMVRQALFNVLGDRVVDARFVDMFAGAGTVGFEALSRGAARATFVEQNAKSLSLIAANAQRFQCADRCRIIRADAARWLRTEPESAAGADVCFIDAPYRDPGIDSLLLLLGEHPPKLVVCEHHRARSLPALSGRLARVRELNHGLTTLTFLQPTSEKIQS
jgi:16S rRNA (guanine966-N2)-methyltransferase